MKEIIDFFVQEKIAYEEIIPLKGDGSARKFFRVKTHVESFVLILPQEGHFGLKEARSYVLIGNFLKKAGVPVPKIFAYHEETGIILVEDLGDIRFQDLPPYERFELFPEVFEVLKRFSEISVCFPRTFVLETLFYDEKLMWEREALYFLDFFVKKYLRQKDTAALLPVLKMLWERCRKKLREDNLLHRDFQARNIMVKGGRIFLIDFQGLRLGPGAYDLASFLIDPYQGLSQGERNYWLKYFQRNFSQAPSEEEFICFALFRNFQILGAFAKLTLLGKTWFATYIPHAVKTLKELLAFFPESKPLSEFLAKNFSS
ncbi:aminoglycoside phosphotransferase family protein [Thermodesulfatator atlanticus]|uniref:aminoglycoside phosphotransferase family protein n=1 Tax=Thermodesulfatator atlanticus TaxID=501497 RepID=UPI0003B47529|nr:phosphotransferase [Thermodesulfatator atlanticus]